MYPYPDERADPIDDVPMHASSADDCTGLIPAAADESELFNYNELYDFLPQAVRPRGGEENY
ncbi:MAG: hypothetical protein ACI4XA_01175 [Oscillospiraceae bacterium]